MKLNEIDSTLTFDGYGWTQNPKQPKIDNSTSVKQVVRNIKKSAKKDK